MTDAILGDFTVAEVQVFLNCSRSTVYALIQSGELKVYKIGRATRITRESLGILRNGEVT
jgi:excisionase family DNA binding protein